MIHRSQSFDLGRDRVRMKEHDVLRQNATVDEILRRYFTRDPDGRNEIQILADEVGMGKTYVSLAVAFSILERMQIGKSEPDLKGCYSRVLIITPRNQALYRKWVREVDEFVKRCVDPEKSDCERWFRPVEVKRIDELSAELRKGGTRPSVLVTTMGLFSGSKLRHYDLKYRVVLSALFRYWGNRFQVEKRERLLKGAPPGWPNDPCALRDLDEKEQKILPFQEEEILSAIDALDRSREPIDAKLNKTEEILEFCRDISEPYTRDRKSLFKKVERKLTILYKAVVSHLILRDFPLVIVDEAHNWKNGPSTGANGFYAFAENIASRTRRALLLTATPFQLHPKEVIEILTIGDYLKPTPYVKESRERSERLETFRKKTVGAVLENSAATSRRFSREWRRLPKRIQGEELGTVWLSERFQGARAELRRIADRKGEIDKSQLDKIVREEVRMIDPDLRDFMREALRLYSYNADLSAELGALVIRHRRRTGHRLFRIGEETVGVATYVRKKPDNHLLHWSPGLDVRGDGELPHYILMRCVSQMKRKTRKGRRPGRSSLGSALTGCYSTLLESAEGKAVKKHLSTSSEGKVYLDLLMSLVSKDQDPDHPKMQAVVDFIVENWKRGEKTLVFCFRVNTAERLREIVSNRIGKELQRIQARCLGGADKIESLRKRLTAREQGLISIGLDRVLLSWLCAHHSEDRKGDVFSSQDLAVQDSDLKALARISLIFDVPFLAKRVDRVFLNRAVEHVVARRFLGRKDLDPTFRSLLEEMADLRWVSHPYGLDAWHEDDAQGEDAPRFDVRGVHTVYEEQREPEGKEIRKLAEDLRETRSRAHRALLDVYMEGPNLWLGEKPGDAWGRSMSPGRDRQVVARMQDFLWGLSMDSDGEFDWESRRKVFQALRRAVIRESVLVRLLPTSTELEEEFWDTLLVQTFFQPMPGQGESMADRIAVFLEDLCASSGSLSSDDSNKQGVRFALLDSTNLRDVQFAALVKGGGGKENMKQRDRIFTAFNTPLLPEVLVCTQVGQEGIDLHRQCRHVVHYDLAWNPAVMEQRTGRVDRIGSKTFRERHLAAPEEKPFLEISVPFLAGTYDERMYEELRLRAQMFEVLTGGDVSVDNPEGLDQTEDSEGKGEELDWVPIPEEMLTDLRVNLHVWEGKDKR